MENKISPSRRYALDVLLKVNAGCSVEEGFQQSSLKNISKLDSQLAFELVHGVLRTRGQLDWLINKFAKIHFSKISLQLLEILRLSFYQLLFLDKIPPFAAVYEGVEMAKKISSRGGEKFVNAVLRQLLRNKDILPWPKPDDSILNYLSVIHSHPKWLVKRWLDRFGKEDTEELLKWNNLIPLLTVRINSSLIQKTNFIDICEEKEIKVKQSNIIPDAFIIEKPPAVYELPGFNEGWFIVQGESAQIPVEILDPQSGETILDLCAAPGGKSVQTAWKMKNHGRIVAVEKSKKRMNYLIENLKRCKTAIVEPLLFDSRELLANKYGSFDRILVDAPCSGTGVLGKRVETRWQKKDSDIKRHAKLQLELLKKAAHLLKVGGVLVYSTCSLEPEENEEVISYFLNTHPNIKVVPPSSEITAGFKTVFQETPFYHWQSLPQLQKMDGFFITRLEKS